MVPYGHAPLFCFHMHISLKETLSDDRMVQVKRFLYHNFKEPSGQSCFVSDLGDSHNQKCGDNQKLSFIPNQVHSRFLLMQYDSSVPHVR